MDKSSLCLEQDSHYPWYSCVSTHSMPTQMSFYFNWPSWRTASGLSSLKKTLMGLFLPRHSLTAPGLLGENRDFWKPASYHAQPGSRTGAVMPKGRLGRCVKRFNSKTGAASLLWAAAPLRMTLPRWVFPVGENWDAYLERRGTAKLPNIQGQDKGHASTSPTLLSIRQQFFRNQITSLLPWTRLDFVSADTIWTRPYFQIHLSTISLSDREQQWYDILEKYA